MPKGLSFVDENQDTYGFISASGVYSDAIIQNATGIKPVDLPDVAVRVPYRLQDLLQVGVLKTIIVTLDDGAGKRTNRRLYCAAIKMGTIKNKSGSGGLVGGTVAGKIVKSVSLARKASFRLP